MPVIEVPEDCAKLRLTLNGRTADDFLLDKPVSSRTAVQPMIAAARSGHGAGLDAKYTVQSSRDGGETWETIALNVKAGEWTLRSAQLSRPHQGARAAHLRERTRATSKVTEVSLQ